jgi:hypothetical protein
VQDASRDGAQALAPPLDAAPPLPVRVAEARVLECHDKGPAHTPPEQCDHIPAFEKALNDAILANHACVPKDAGAGSIEYVADISFGRRHNPVTIALPRDGRSFQSAKITRDCMAGVRSQLHAFPLAPLQHAHTRYKIAVIATYAGSSGP